MRLIRAVQGLDVWAEVCASVVGDGPEVGDSLKQGRRRRTIRTSIGGDRSVIVKIWQCKPRLRSRLSVRLGMTTAYREWRIPQLLEKRGVPAARSLAYFSFIAMDGQMGEAVVLEDLGRCRSPGGRAKRLANAGEDEDLAVLDAKLIDITARLVETGFVDTDHSLANFAITPSGELVRLDFEHCHHLGTIGRRLRPGMYGTMLGRLIGTYSFAVQPRRELTFRLASRLVERLDPPRVVLRHAKRVVDELMDRQYRKRGIAAAVDLSW